MSVSGLCAVCGEAGADHACDRCGALVCDEHYERSLGLCVECTAEVAPGGRRGGGEGGGDAPDGVDTYRF